MSIALNYGAASHLGKVRKSNQDSGYAGPNLLVLADGMGGPAGGDIASAVAVDYLQKLDCQILNQDTALQNLVQSEAAAHDELCDHSNANPELTGLGTTCIAILRTDDQLTLTHIGDSRAYLLRDKELYQVTKDHSYVQQLIDEGRISVDEAANHPHRSVLLRVLGDSQVNPELDTMVIDPEIGDRWLLCSDGLCGYVEEASFKKVLEDVKDPQLSSEKLIELALNAGGIDNVTCIVADIVASNQENLPENPIIVGSAANYKKLEKLRKQLQESLQSETLLEVNTDKEKDDQNNLNTPIDGTATIEEVAESDTDTDMEIQSSEKSQERRKDIAYQEQPEPDIELVEAFSPEPIVEKKTSILKIIFFIIAIILVLLLATYMIATYLGFDINLPHFSAVSSRNAEPFISDLFNMLT